MNYRFLSPALQELEDADVAEELGDSIVFIDEVDAAIGRILHYPEAWAKIADDYRRSNLRRISIHSHLHDCG